MVSPLYEFLNVFLKKQDVQKTLDKEYNQMVYLLYEFLNVLSERRFAKDFGQRVQLNGFSPV
jgi:hypothetical protein